MHRIVEVLFGCSRQYIGGGRWFTCVACHPEERCIATGDNTGRVLIWWNLLTSGKPTWAVYHWHTLPVQAVTFSQTGNIHALWGCVSLAHVTSTGCDFLTDR